MPFAAQIGGFKKLGHVHRNQFMELSLAERRHFAVLHGRVIAAVDELVLSGFLDNASGCSD